MSISTLMKKLRNDFVLTLFANIFSYFVAFCGSVIYVRLLGKESFGLYTFAFNIVSLFLLVNGFGAASGVLQYVSKAKTEVEQQDYLRFAFQSGSLFNLCISILIVAYALIIPLPVPQAKPILLAMALFPVGRLYMDVFQSYMRATQQNILQSKFLIINNCILLASNVVGILTFSLYGLVYSTYIGYLIMLIYSTWQFNLPPIFKFYRFMHINVRQFISYSFLTTLTNAFSGVIFVLDIIIISYIVKDPKLIAVYRVATIIPFAINFIPNIAVNYYYPEFAKNSHSPAKIKQLARWISQRIFMFSFAVSVFLIVAAKPLILMIFGSNYMDSILPFQIISFGYWIIASFRVVNGNILAALGKARLNFYMTAIILLINITVTYLMVKYYSINGAAFAILIIYILSSLTSYITLKLIIRGLEK